ncbi:hypothetical protein BO82DRAFT_393813 [Aspergillus uvarum CBS 121591]|uniref:Uncharacterized protein n=1 Tax=Aspergillus uvarum CBS 121591 TaxID=1448315 RepID=A0A319CLQ8_9EURO|nr:hypothetical protein BO82DRAFT_393813 [Aspergillus uvarum CBS 121591]PYH79593.1 hypothetical protein BO82DRAFT_393813 [Aspergillus uvarum CBS 121591]
MCNILFGRSSKSDLTAYLLLDGIEQMDKQHMKQFLHVLDEWQSSPQGWSRFTLRILLTGRTEIMRRVKDQLGDGISVIDIASKNRDDILKFITSRMNKIDVLSGATDQVNSLREEILNGLAKRTDGDFINIGLLLDEISTKQRPGEIRNIIARSGENRSDTIARTIATLNDTLSDEDISDLIELLTWVIFASRPLGANELEAVLFLKTGEASLRPLIEKLRGPYSSLFHIAAARVHFASESIADFLLQSSTPNDPNETPRDAGDVSESEVRIVRRFLKSVCDPALFAKFEFDEFFQRKLKGKTVRIAVDSELAHLKLASACLEVICSCDSPNLNPLLDYAVQFFGKHLALADPALTLPRHKIALGPLLVKVFTDEEVIDRWWSHDLYNLRMHWIYLDDYAEVIMKWLQDSAVTKNISQEHRQWIKSLSSKSHLDADLLEHVGKVVAHKWLHAYPWDKWDFVGFFMVIRGYMTKIKNRTNPSTARALQDPHPDTIPVSDILDAAEWAQAQIGLRELGYEETYNLARTLREWQKYQEAIEQFKHASTLAEENWLSQYGLATCYASNGNLKVAIDILEATMKRIRDGDFGNFKVTDIYLLSMSDELARWYKSIGRDEVALAIYRKQLNADLSDYQTAFNLIQLLHQQAKYTDLVKFLQSLKNAIDPDSGLDLRTRNVQRHSRNQFFNEALFALAQDGAEFNLVLESYEEALVAVRNQMLEARKADDILEERRAQLNLVEIMMLIATLRQRASYRDPIHEKCAVDHWTHIMEMDGTHDWFLSTKQASVRSEFALFCFEKAIRSPDLAAEYVQHLENIVSEVSLRNADDVYWLKRSHPSCLLARYHRLQGNHGKAKSILRFYVKLNLDLLSDDDPLNDWEAYFGLAVLSMFAGDEADALAAWSLITPSGVPEAETRLDNTKKNHHELKGPMVFSCNGDCGTDWTFADNFNVCKTCFDVQLDHKCLDKLRAGTLEVKVCNPEHDMLRVPAYDASEHKRMGKGNVKVGEDILKVEEWLRRVRRDWGLEAA